MSQPGRTSLGGSGPRAASEGPMLPPLLPRPKRVHASRGALRLHEAVPIVLAPGSDDSDLASAQALREAVADACGDDPDPPGAGTHLRLWLSGFTHFYPHRHRARTSGPGAGIVTAKTTGGTETTSKHERNTRGNLRARYRTPVEVGWDHMCKFDHDFLGRAALEAEVAHPRRTVVTLRWNPDDVLDTWASLLRPGEAYKTLDLPYAPNIWPQAHADHIVKDGRRIGISSGTIYSYHFREVLSMGCIDLEASQIGTKVIVQWGDHGGKIKDVRATVARFPYLAEGRNSDLDVADLR